MNDQNEQIPWTKLFGFGEIDSLDHAAESGGATDDQFPSVEEFIEKARDGLRFFYQ